MSEVLQRKPVDLTAWHLVDQAAMMVALGDLMGEGWRGAVSHNGTTWQLELNADAPSRHITAVVGEWLVDDMCVRKLTAEECAANYDEGL